MGNENSLPNDPDSGSEETEQSKKANIGVKKLQASLQTGNLPAYLQEAKKKIEKIKQQEAKAANEKVQHAKKVLGLEPCSAKQFGDKKIRQDAWICNTCSLNQTTKKAICKQCADYCHKGCDV